MAPYEVKAPAQVLRLAAYGLLLEGDVVREQPIEEADKQAVRDILAEVQAVVTSETMPQRAPASHCRDCVYAKICV